MLDSPSERTPLASCAKTGLRWNRGVSMPIVAGRPGPPTRVPGTINIPGIFCVLRCQAAGTAWTGNGFQGLSVGIGAAQAKRLNKDPHLVFTLHGDGELQEGQIWEAAMYAAGKNVDNLIATVDWNGRQIDGDTEKIMPLGDLKAKWLAFGWDVLEIQGNDMAAVIAGLAEAKSRTGRGKPVCILMRTEMGMGVDFMVGSHEWHGIPPNDEQLAKALSQLPETLGDY